MSTVSRSRTVREVNEILSKAGFKPHEKKGNAQVWRKPLNTDGLANLHRKSVTIAGGDAEVLSPRACDSIFAAAGIDILEFDR